MTTTPHAHDRTTDSTVNRLSLNPLVVLGYLFLLAGLGLAAYHGLAQLDVLPRVSWVSWSHIHYVTVGGFSQILLGLLPQVAARKLDQPTPPRWYALLNAGLLTGGFLLLWYGRGFGHPRWFDAGLVVVWLLVLGLLLVVLRMALRSPYGWDPTVALFILSPFVFLWGITYAWGLYAHAWRVPGGWLGLREAHVHANAWGFLAFAVVGTLYELFPRLVKTDLYSQRLKRYSVPFFAAGIFPLITGPWLGMGRSVTATGLVLYATGFALYLYNLLRTYRAGTESGVARMLLASQFWLLGPAGFAPFVLFGVEWVPTTYIEQGALHFFFVGWALPIAFAGLTIAARSFHCPRAPDGGEPTDGVFPALDVPDVERWRVWVWNLAVLVVGFGFFYQDRGWSTALFGVGYAVIAALWLWFLLAAARDHRRRLAAASTT
ncbi:MAG: hypothetical protein ABEJ22_00845 [Haloferacaceae archaeon]